MRHGLNLIAWVGPLIVFGGVVSYFMVFARFPALRDFPWVNLPIVAVGLFMSALGCRRAFASVATRWPSKLFASLGFLASSALTLLFTAYIFYLSYQLPDTARVVRVSQAAPDFQLVDQNGQTVQLDQFRGSKLVVDFYRGHW